MRCLFILLIVLLFGCRDRQASKLNPSDTILNKQQRDWEKLYARELDNALKNDDLAAFYFFWPLYLEARYENKRKKFENHNIIK